ncbi:MAG: MFS transporter [Chloroflexota bacterium]|nr:MFS transporter [Chloroflexota bacterium]
MTSSTAPAPAASIWDKQHLSLTTGSILATTLVAFQGLAMATVAPIVADDIGGRELYGWMFSAFLLPQIVGTVLGGREVDRRSPARVFLISLVLFALGCVIAGAASSISMLFLGRAVQGFGAGAMFSCVYAVVSSAYEDRLRPTMLAAMSSAWIVPSLIGPAIAGFVAEELSWRLAFFGLVPLLAIVAPLTIPTYARIPLKPTPTDSDNRLLLSIVLAISTGLFLAGLEVNPWLAGAAISIVGLAGLVPTLKRLLPEGSFRARPVMPAAIVTRGLGFGGFAVCETYMIFALKDVGGVPATEAGLVLTVTSLMWTGGSLVQARWDRATGARQRPLRIVTGFTILFLAALALFLCIAIFKNIWLWVTLVSWAFAGLGMGLAYPTTVSIAFAHTPPGKDGMVSSSALLADLFAFSIGAGLGGVLLALGESAGWSTAASAALAMSLGVVLILMSIGTGLRTREPRQVGERLASTLNASE